MSFPKPFFRWRPHPWHGLDVGPEPPTLVNAFIEISPFDLVKYEVDKVTGYLRVDRPQAHPRLSHLHCTASFHAHFADIVLPN